METTVGYLETWELACAIGLAGLIGFFMAWLFFKVKSKDQEQTRSVGMDEEQSLLSNRLYRSEEKNRELKLNNDRLKKDLTAAEFQIQSLESRMEGLKTNTSGEG